MTVKIFHFFVPEQTTDASLPWLQLWFPKPRLAQSVRCRSVPAQDTSSSQIGPAPGPKMAPPGAMRARPQPSSRHTTPALARPQPWSHTVPHVPLWCTSTRPAHWLPPPTKRTEVRPAGGERGGEKEGEEREEGERGRGE
ncbi:hypothetical protein ANANG_G00217950, partial [Anguilla anguilla]